MVHTAPHCRTKKINNGDVCNRPNVSASRYTSRQNFNVNQALMSVDYVIKFSKLNYGITYKKFRQLAYNYGRRLQSKFPNIWIVKQDCRNWLVTGLFGWGGHKLLMLRMSENTRLFKTTAFKKRNVMESPTIMNGHLNLGKLLLKECIRVTLT
jgi:hypothetical protein